MQCYLEALTPLPTLPSCPRVDPWRRQLCKWRRLELVQTRTWNFAYDFPPLPFSLSFLLWKCGCTARKEGLLLMAALMLCKRAGICLPCSIPHCPGCCCIIFGNNFSTLLSRILSSLFGGKTLPKLVRVRSTSCKGLLASFLPFLEKGIIPAFVQLGRDMPGPFGHNCLHGFGHHPR